MFRNCHIIVVYTVWTAIVYADTHHKSYPYPKSCSRVNYHDFKATCERHCGGKCVLTVENIPPFGQTDCYKCEKYPENPSCRIVNHFGSREACKHFCKYRLRDACNSESVPDFTGYCHQCHTGIPFRSCSDVGQHKSKPDCKKHCQIYGTKLEPFCHKIRHDGKFNDAACFHCITYKNPHDDPTPRGCAILQQYETQWMCAQDCDGNCTLIHQATGCYKCDNLKDDVNDNLNVAPYIRTTPYSPPGCDTEYKCGRQCNRRNRCVQRKDGCHECTKMLAVPLCGTAKKYEVINGRMIYYQEECTALCEHCESVTILGDLQCKKCTEFADYDDVTSKKTVPHTRPGENYGIKPRSTGHVNHCLMPACIEIVAVTLLIYGRM